MIERVLQNVQLRRACGHLAPGRTVRLSGLWGSSASLAAAAMGRLGGAPVLFITPHLDDADEVADDVEVFRGKPAQLFPAWEVDVAAEHLNDEVTGERLRLCHLLAQPAEQRDEPVDFIVAPVMALLQPTPTPEALAAGRMALQRAGRLEPDALIEWLIDAGYDPVDQVDQQGQFAHRGGIVDILPVGVARPVRVEFFGDQIDSIRRFDLDTQRSTEPVETYDVPSLAIGRVGTTGQTHLLKLLPPETIICMVEPGEVMDLAGELYRRVQDGILHRRAKEDGGGSGSPDSQPGAVAPSSIGLVPPEEVFLDLARFALVEMYTFSPKTGKTGAAAGSQEPPTSPRVGPDAEIGDCPHFALGVCSLQRISLNTHEALRELTELSESAEVWVYCENPAEQNRFRDLLQATEPTLAVRAHTGIGHVHGGFYWPAEKLVVVGHHELFHRYSKVRRIRRVRAGRPIESLLDLQEGDHVVHVAHGIARFDGLRKMEQDGRSEEYLRLRFADNAVLNIPASGINLVQKYIGARGKRPSLSKLGGAQWARQKERVGAAVQDLAAEMLRIQAVRQSMPGFSFPPDTDWQRQFCQEFIYSETEDQIGSMQQIDQDMIAPRPMDRLLCGDVGYGKTELAMRAAFRVVEAGKQVAVLVPTTVLADQHFRTFTERLADYPFQVDVLSRFKTPGEQKKVLERLARGQIDILIGTHRLLSKDVRFADLGLVVIDEEQRFGVSHKEHLKNLRATVDVLTMTATPIPRTMHMALLGLRDISNLTTPPLDRRAIHTEVCHYDDDLIRSAVLRELNRDGQVFFLHNRVMDIEHLAEHVARLVPEARLTIAHGQMPEGRLEKAMLRFVRREADVLVCTTIIESGLDIPTANTIIIHNADRFGLSELHQLRGRVGRYKHRAYCYLLLPRDRPVSPSAAKRLKAIEDFSDLGAGFQIAMRDLEIRGAGNILGREQSGHIATVGYELYCQLLEQTVKQSRGEALPARRDVHVELGIDAYIPPSYVASERQRMEIYRRLVRCAGAEELKQLAADLTDAYGEPPAVVRTMLDLAEIRVRAGELGIDSIIRMDPDIVLLVRDFAAAKCVFDGAVGTVRLPDAKTVHWRLPPVLLKENAAVNVLLRQLRQARAKG